MKRGIKDDKKGHNQAEGKEKFRASTSEHDWQNDWYER
jgi:hypothetical protein